MTVAFQNLPVSMPRDVLPRGFHCSSQEADYYLTECIGEGASGCVYSATRRPKKFPKHREEVAVKIFLPLQRIACNPQGLRQGIARFQSEAQRGRLLAHPNLAPFMDSGFLVAPDTSASYWDGLPFYTMPFIRGKPLIDLLASDATLKTRLTWLKQLSSALEYLHSNGIQHRDVKPENIIVQTDSHQLYLVDLGVAKWNSFRSDLTDAFSTETGVNLTTWEYTPRETEAEGLYNNKSDVWAFCKVALEVVCKTRVARIDILTNLGRVLALMKKLQAAHPFLEYQLQSGLNHKPSKRPSVSFLRHALSDYSRFLDQLKALTPADYAAVANLLPKILSRRERETEGQHARIISGRGLRPKDFPAYNWRIYIFECYPLKMKPYPNNGCPKCGSKLWLLPYVWEPGELEGQEYRVCFGAPGAPCGHMWGETIIGFHMS